MTEDEKSFYDKYADEVTSGIEKPAFVPHGLWFWAHHYMQDQAKNETYSGWSRWIKGEGEEIPWETYYTYWLLRDFGYRIPEKLHKRLWKRIAQLRVLGE
jgi:hypothetical protein